MLLWDSWMQALLAFWTTWFGAHPLGGNAKDGTLGWELHCSRRNWDLRIPPDCMRLQCYTAVTAGTVLGWGLWQECVSSFPTHLKRFMHPSAHTVFVFLWLISLNIIPSESIHVAGKFILFCVWEVLHCVYITTPPLSVHLLMDMCVASLSCMNVCILSPCLGNCKCFYEHWGAWILSN